MYQRIDYPGFGASHEDALGVVISDAFGDDVYDFGRRHYEPEDDEPRGISDMIGDAGYHPDRTPVDVLMADTHLGLSVGFALLDDDA